MPGGVSVRSTRADWWQSVAKRRDVLSIKLMKSKAPYVEHKRALLEQAEALMREAKTPAERRHIQRLTLQEIITEAYASGAHWDEFGALLRRIQRLGFADITHRIHVACLFVQSLPRFPQRTRQAFAMLAEAERMLKRIRKSHPLRSEGMQGIAHARAVAAAAGITPPK
jgi:uncharacterized protein (DUF2461 family)